jgi:hypothetical protein
MPKPRFEIVKAVQFSVGLDNTSGTLAKLAAFLHKRGINIEAISVADNTDCGWVRLVATPSAKARVELARGRYLVCAQLVLLVRAVNRPGELERVARLLAKAGVNIDYVYGSTAPGESSTLVMGVSDVEDAMKALGV